MNKILVIVDMQNDFVDINGALKVPNADKVCDNIVNKIRNWDGDNNIICTYDTHLQEHYLNTEEGKNIPLHCIYNTWGRDLHEFICEALVKYSFANNNTYFTIEKDTFGSISELPALIEELYPENPFEIHICGVCTDICVISNALILRAAFPMAHIVVDASCCAGTTEENHLAALEVMKANCIEIENMEATNG